MAKMGCAKCGGTKKMKAGGSTLSKSAIKKAPVQLYGIPQENMGTSGQYGKMKRGGVAKKVTTKLVKAKSGMSLKKVPSGKVGLAKLPTAVRNKMGYMKSGGPRKSLKRYQSEGEVMEPTPAPTPASIPTRTLANAIEDNLKIGMSKNRAISLAKKELGLKTSVDPNTVINAIGNAASAVGNTVNAFKRKGGASKFVSKKPAMKKGGVTRKVMIKSKKK
jgi:hypothetical protein